jgi:2-aminoethylphosphonate-pyruvate transaminase
MPRDELILFTPGPVRIPASVAHALSHPRCNYHRQDAFRDMFKETEVLLKQLIGIKNADDYYATVMTATGTGVNEACMLAFEPLGKGLIIENGFFAARAIDQAKQNNIAIETLHLPSDRPIDVAAVEAVLDRDASIKWVFFVSHETRAGLRNPLEQLGRSIKQRGRMLAVDVISSAYAYPIDLEAAQVDLATASSAKAIMAAPGLGVIFTRKAAVPALEAAGRQGQPRGYYLDVVAEYQKQVKEAQTRFAQPVCLHAALHAACTHLAEIGIERHYQRVQDQMSALIEHLAKLGSEPLLADAFRSNIAVNFRLPVGTPYTRFSKQMEELGYFCLYGIPGDQSHFQLSTIGDLTDAHIDGMKSALSEVLKR